MDNLVRKKILIGSIFVLVLILLMPSIPAVQQKSVEEGFKQELKDRLESINLNDVEDIEKLEWIRHPILYLIVTLVYTFRFLRGCFLEDISCYYDDSGWTPRLVIEHPILYFRGVWLFYTAMLAYTCIWVLSELLGWNWPFL